MEAAPRGGAVTKAFWPAAGSASPRRLGSFVRGLKAVSSLRSATAVQDLAPSRLAAGAWGQAAANVVALPRAGARGGRGPSALRPVKAWLLRGFMALLCLGRCALAVPPVSTGTIVTTISPATPVATGEVITVTCRMSDYSGTNEIDSFNFLVEYDPEKLQFVPDSFDVRTNAAADPQWLTLTNQESVVDGFRFNHFSAFGGAGLLTVGAAEHHPTPTPRGTVAPSGFLASFRFVALVHGSSELRLKPYDDGSVLRDIWSRPVGSITLTGATVRVRHPTTLVVEAIDPIATEPGTDTGQVRFTRYGPTNDTFLIDYHATGRASRFTDFRVSPIPLYMPAGSSNVVLTVTPRDDELVEGDEAALFVLYPSTNYDIGTPSNATVIIKDKANAPPRIELRKPPNGAAYTAPTNLLLQAEASDAEGAIALVEFFVEATNKLGEAASPPCEFTWIHPPGAIASGGPGRGRPVRANLSASAANTRTSCPRSESSKLTATVNPASNPPPGWRWWITFHTLHVPGHTQGSAGALNATHRWQHS
jgi:hypothetical protein